jgi:hypothetical protein
VLPSATWNGSANLSISPGQQLVDPIYLVVGDTAENISQPSLRINAIELGRLCGSANYAERPVQLG